VRYKRGVSFNFNRQVEVSILLKQKPRLRCSLYISFIPLLEFLFLDLKGLGCDFVKGIVVFSLATMGRKESWGWCKGLHSFKFPKFRLRHILWIIKCINMGRVCHMNLWFYLDTTTTKLEL